MLGGEHKKSFLIIIVLIIGFVLGILFKLFGYLFAIFFLLILFLYGLVTKGVRFKKLKDLTKEEKSYSILALLIFILSMVSSYFLSYLLS